MLPLDLIYHFFVFYYYYSLQFTAFLLLVLGNSNT